MIRDDYQLDAAGRPVAGGIKGGKVIEEGRLPIDDYLDAMEELLAIEEEIEREQQQQEETTGGDGDPDQYGGIADNSSFGGSTGGLAGSRSGGTSAHPVPALRRVWFTQANGRHYSDHCLGRLGRGQYGVGLRGAGINQWRAQLVLRDDHKQSGREQ